MSNITISGTWETRRVRINGKYLSPIPSQKILNHSPDGFNWSYGGSGPAQLALAILLTQTDESTALYLHQYFKWDVVAKLPKSDFEISLDIRDYIHKKFNERKTEVSC